MCRKGVTRDAEPEPEPEPEPPEPTNFGRSRSRRNGLLGAGAGAGAVKNGAAPAPKRDTIVATKTAKQQETAEQTPCRNFSSITLELKCNELLQILLTDRRMHLI